MLNVLCRRTALNEVYAHAVLGKHTHVVRYYSAWAENSHMYIQNEFCNGKIQCCSVIFSSDKIHDGGSCHIDGHNLVAMHIFAPILIQRL